MARIASLIGLADIRALRQAEQMGEPRLIRQLDHARRTEIRRPDLPPRSGLWFEILFHRHEADSAGGAERSGRGARAFANISHAPNRRNQDQVVRAIGPGP